MGEGSKKRRSFRMCLNLNDYQFRTSRYIYRSTYEPHGYHKSKLTIDRQKLSRKKHKHTTEENHQTTREQTKRREKNRRTTITTSKQVTKWQEVHTYQ